ncbi:hypothetical protein KZZ52_21690 [Dactylosporangium sp. AC04546]|uniref:hypothetical protein n=1 Tax=Dactylosporangium sp. AC04546 TaxID=2862460 RepID=UPI001EDF3CB5|nr:hypothetical protein [Dactylosporangium sp. AC04546]WVK87895.1 hypothetical protein KZZ52_21690 [Dactylosporangium sp. AC04546]
MTIRSRGLRAALATMSLAATMIVVQAGFAGTAHARCIDVNRPEVGRITVAGVTYATATPRTNTCNNNNTETTDFQANEPGWRATYRWQNNGLWSSSSGGYNQSVNTAVFSDNNSHSLVLLCADNEGTVPAGTPPTYYCGWYDVAVSTSVNYTFAVVSEGF